MSSIDRAPPSGSPAAPRRWVLMRGLAREQGHWGDFADRLRTAFPGAVIDLPDLPGCGAQRGCRAPLSIAGALEIVRGDLGRGGRQSYRVWLLGLSLGSMVAYEWMRRYPAEIAGGVLVNGSLGGLSLPWRRLRLGAAASLLRALVTTDPLSRERRLFALTSARPDLADATVAAWTELARRQPVRRIDVARQLLAAALYRARRLPGGRSAVLVLASRGDRMVDPSCSRAIAKAIPGAALRVHPTAGHDLPLDDPGWVISAVSEWSALEEAAAGTTRQ
jgi:pimeloyl-ACP methyl ester carboxylesterase